MEKRSVLIRASYSLAKAWGFQFLIRRHSCYSPVLIVYMTDEARKASDSDLTSKEVKDDVHQALIGLKTRAATLGGAYAATQRGTGFFPDVMRFTPHEEVEVDFQSFNTTLALPHRFENAEEIADWLMDTSEERLNRRSVAAFLGDTSSQISAATLETIASKICQHERVSTSSFIEALKVFLPLSGILDAALAHDSEDQGTLLTAIATAHLQHSKSSSSSLSSSLSSAATTTSELAVAAAPPPKAVALLVATASHVVTAACAMIEGRRPPTEIRDSFRHALEAAHNAPSSPSKGPDRSVAVAAAETELVSGRPIALLPAASREVPTHLFSHPLRAAWGRLRFAHDEVGSRRFLVLSHDALYFFDAEVFGRQRREGQSRSSFPALAVPLKQCNAHLDPDRQRIDLLTTTGVPVSVLVNHALTRPGHGHKHVPWWGVSAVELQPAIVLELLDGAALPSWADALENACWAAQGGGGEEA